MKPVSCYRKRLKNRRVFMGEQHDGTFLVVVRRLLLADESNDFPGDVRIVERCGLRMLETKIAFTGQTLDTIHELHKALTKTQVYTITFDCNWKKESWTHRAMRRLGLAGKQSEWKS